MIEPSDEEVNRFVHRLLHLRARRGLEPFAEACLIADACWQILDGPVPDWAVDLANAGEPGSRWCPVITAGLRGEANPSTPEQYR